MQVTFWGVRGSVPSPGRFTWRYGGNTPCLEVRTAGRLLLLDAGTGIREFGNELLSAPAAPLDADLLFSHYHWDHIQGLPFFGPMYFPGTTVRMHGPRPPDGSNALPGVVQALFRAPFFPVPTSALNASFPLDEFDAGSEFSLGPVRVRTARLRHPQGGLAYRFDADGVSFVYATDHEPGDPEFDRGLRALARGADLLISDAQYRPDELAAAKTGWGHGSWEASAGLARAADVKNLALFHHEPLRSDDELDELLHLARQIFPNTWSASEGMLVEVARKEVRFTTRGARLSQRAPVPLLVKVESQQGGAVTREEAKLVNLGIQGAYFLSPRPYEPRQTIDIDVPLAPVHGEPVQGEPAHGVNGHAAAAGCVRLRGYVIRSEHLTSNGGWCGVAVQFPGSPASGTLPELEATPAGPEPAVPPKPDSD